MRVGGEYVEASLAAQGHTLVVANAGEVKADLVPDTVEVLTSFWARRRGRRAARNRAQKALAAR